MLETPVSKDYPGGERFNKDMGELNKRLMDICEAISIQTGPEDIQKDGIHLTASGYVKWREAVKKVLK
jgi:lysophospholipase L1-like esterase